MLAFYLSVLETQEDKDLFEEYYRLYRGSMYNIAFSILHNNEDAEDAVNEAFLCIANKFEKIRKISCQEVKAYYVIIIRNTSINIYRKNKSRSNYCEPLEDNDAPVEVDFFGQIDRKTLPKAIASLPDEYKDLIFMYYGKNQTAKEIASYLGTTQAAVWKRLDRARKLLREALEKGVTNG